MAVYRENFTFYLWESENYLVIITLYFHENHWLLTFRKAEAVYFFFTWKELNFEKLFRKFQASVLYLNYDAIWLSISRYIIRCYLEI